MKRTRLLVCACFMLATTSLAVAQQPTRLLIEVTVDGSLVARPELRVPSGSDGHVEISNAPNPRLSGLRETITVTPTVRGDDVAIAFKISSGGKADELPSRRCVAPIAPRDACKQFQPSLVISKDIRGSVEWTSPTAGQVRLTVSWVE